MSENEGQAATAPIQNSEKQIDAVSQDEIAEILGNVSQEDDGTPIQEGVDALKGIISDDELKSINEAVEEETEGPKKEASKEDSKEKKEDHLEVDDDVQELLENIEDSEGTETTEDAETDNQEEGSEEFSGKITIVHNGENVEVDSNDVQELVQKGYDYTQKTMALADEKKAFEAEQAEVKQELEQAIATLEKKYSSVDEDLKIKETWDFTLDNMKTEDPDLFEQVQDYYKGVHKFASNPLMDRQAQKIAQLEQRLEQSLTAKEDETIRAQYNTEKENLTAKLAPTLKKLNFNPDWNKVQQAYIDGAATVEKAFYAAHGADIIKLAQSKSKVDSVKSSVKGKKKIVTPDSATKFRKLPEGKTLKDISYNQLVNHLSGF